MRRGTIASFAALAIGAALACGVITIPPDPTAPTNSCTDDPSCATLFPDASTSPTCAAGSCSVQGFANMSPFLVVAIPRDVVGLGGVTMPLPPNYAALRQKTGLPAGCSTTPDGVECDPIPPLTSFQGGSLQFVTGDFDVTLWPPGGFLPNQKKNPINPPTVALPVAVTFEMLWTDPATGHYMLARKLGIALDDTTGTTSTNNQLNAPTASIKHQPGFEFSGKVPQPFSPDDPMSAYTMNVVPVDPYGVVPPFVFGRTDKDGTAINPLPTPVAQAGLVPLSTSLFGAIPPYNTPIPDSGSPVWKHDFEVDEDPSGPSLEGWTVHIDDADGHRLSGNVVLGAGTTKNITMYEATGTNAQVGETLYIDPPPSFASIYPRYRSPSIFGQIVGPFPYPALPKPVTLSGSVLNNDAQTVPARIAFSVSPANSADYILEADGTTPATSLVYSQVVTTDSSGHYTATLPPGNLRVYVAPDDPSLALTVTDTLISPTDGGVQAGKSFTVRRRSHVKGRVVLENGTPVFAADVVISASADSEFMPNDDPRQRPRESRGATDVNGTFDVPADPGLVDISIRPRDGTKFPWVVLMNRTVPLSDGADGGGLLTLSLSPDIVIPAPSRYTQQPMGELTDSVGNPIARAVVRAYAFPPVTPGPDGGPPQTRGARLIGMTFTDDNAFFQLFLAPPE